MKTPCTKLWSMKKREEMPSLTILLKWKTSSKKWKGSTCLKILNKGSKNISAVGEGLQVHPSHLLLNLAGVKARKRANIEDKDRAPRIEIRVKGQEKNIMQIEKRKSFKRILKVKKNHGNSLVTLNSIWKIALEAFWNRTNKEILSQIIQFIKRSIKHKSRLMKRKEGRSLKNSEKMPKNFSL